MCKTPVLLVYLALIWLSAVQAAVFHRGDKISDHFKQLNLAAEEIDPDVAPSGPNRIEMNEVVTEEIFNTNNENEIPDEAENEIIDDSANEISESAVTELSVAAATTVAPVTAAAPVETSTTAKPEEETSGLAKYCKCQGSHCDCCRTFNLPFIPVKGPACARMSYLGNDKMSISLKYGDLTLASRTISSKRARPICVGLPGGYSQFCGRVYGFARAKENFKACLGFELRADDEVEAALRVSCFKFGPEGLRVAEAEPLPVEINKEEDDDDDDIFGFGAGTDDEDDEDDYDEDDEEEEDAEDDADTDTDYNDDEADEEEAPADADYGGFSLGGLLDELDDDDDDDDSKPSSTPALTSPATLAVSEAVTRTAADAVQSKGSKDTVAGSAPARESTATVAPAVVTNAAVNAVTEQVTAVHDSVSSTTAKTKKSKKSKKNKKKKDTDAEGDFAFELLNGLLDFFN